MKSFTCGCTTRKPGAATLRNFSVVDLPCMYRQAVFCRPNLYWYEEDGNADKQFHRAMAGNTTDRLTTSVLAACCQYSLPKQQVNSQQI
jgi:hypothetical protein